MGIMVGCPLTVWRRKPYRVLRRMMNLAIRRNTLRYCALRRMRVMGSGLKKRLSGLGGKHAFIRHGIRPRVGKRVYHPVRGIFEMPFTQPSVGQHSLIMRHATGASPMFSLQQTAIFLTAAVVAVPLFRWLRLSSIVGYLAAGLAIGPWGLRLVTEVDHILHTAEFGIVLLMFIIGLELQPSRLWALRRTVFGLGGAEVGLCTVLLAGAARLCGLPPVAALVVGFGLSLSSTPLVLQVLVERGELKAQQGRSAFGILLFQDLAVLPMLAILPLLSADSALPDAGGSPWLALAKLVAALAGVVLGGRLILRPLLRVVAKTGVTEAFTAASLLTIIATALLVNQVGLSMALGAFMAGVLLADSEFRHQLEADIEPFKGLLLGLFFIAVGMSANLGLVVGQPLALLAVTLGFLSIKILAVSALGKLTRHRGDSAFRLGFTLPAGGEFAFVLFTLAVRQRIVDEATADLLVLAVTLSMMVGPLLIGFYDACLQSWFSPVEERPFDPIEERENRIIIAGFGRFGQIVARLLRAKHIRFTALDSNQTQVDFVRRFGNKVFYGDASRLDLLRAAGAEQAEIFVLAIDDAEASVRVAELLREHFPHLKVFARARNRQHAFRLMDLGVRYLIRETYVSSLELTTAVLETLGETRADAANAVRLFRRHDEKTLAAQHAVKEDEAKLIASSKESAQQLESLFEADQRDAEAAPGARPPGGP
ncbi:Glutathione-regulated potassium-efflux system protein KefC [Anaerolineae bacterium]|nr:Glutathione-regulated potassium-efflux system protein KefC [Anaerolineae bacterium]